MIQVYHKQRILENQILKLINNAWGNKPIVDSFGACGHVDALVENRSKHAWL